MSSLTDQTPRPGQSRAGCRLFRRGAMSRRGNLRIVRSRAPRGRRSADTRGHAQHCRDAKRALKHAALRDCGRRCVYCAEQLVLENATLDHVYPLARGGAHARRQPRHGVRALQSPQGRHAPARVLRPLPLGRGQLRALCPRRASRAQARGAARRQPRLRRLTKHRASAACRVGRAARFARRTKCHGRDGITPVRAPCGSMRLPRA